MSERDNGIVTTPSVAQVGRIVNLSDKPVLHSETPPVYRAGEKQHAPEPIDLDAMFREIKRRLHSLEAVETENRALRLQLSHAHCQVAAATKLLRMLIAPDMNIAKTDEALIEYQARFGKL